MRTMGKRGMVASPHYLATGAGLAVLRRGGTAIDAAIATNAVLAVVAPYLCGMGGDLFAQVYSAVDGTIAGLNASGRAPAAATLQRMRELAGGDSIPARSALAVTVPGCIDGWGELHRRFGRLELADVLRDALHYAEEGFPVTANFARAIELSSPFFHPAMPARETFLPNGSPPREGEILRQPRLAATLRTIGREGPDVVYRGAIAAEIARSIQASGGVMSREDLAAHHADWVEPLSIRYRDVTVYELPPNSQGVIALEILGILDNLPSERLAPGGEEWVHLLAEATRLAYADRAAHLTDPDHMRIAPADLLRPERLEKQAAQITATARGEMVPGGPGSTIYLCTADDEGNLVSLIESNWMGIGSGVMAGETGIMLHNRGHWFSLDDDAANVIAPGKRTMHTLMPGLAFRQGRPWLVFGTMGGSGQPQIHVEILTRLIDGGLPLDEAIRAPRFDAVVGAGETGRPAIALEDRFPADVISGLRARGHDTIQLDRFSSAVGHAHAIQVEDGGVYIGAADPRHDSLALGY